jgi:cytochrome d ubiquinol oxidase subunit I
MDALALARLQFAATTIYHFFFVPLTLGLGPLVAIVQTLYYRSGDEVYKRMAQFWGKLFLINFAMGVVTGIVQEFQFGMNWSEYSRFVGDIFGAPLAIEALLTFFLESTFLGVWFFGWNRLPKGVHLASIWLVVIGSWLSALWILIANSFMQAPMGYGIDPATGRAVMTDFFALIGNPNVWLQFPHVIFSGITTAAFFALGISAWHLLRKQHPDFFRRSFRIAAIYAMIGSALVIVIGHQQAQHMVRTQPMKMAAAEALWESEDPAGLSLLNIFDEGQRRDLVSIRIPGALSFLSYNRFTGEVKGIKDLQLEYEQKYGAGKDYVPPVTVSYWTFRGMVGAGFLMALLALIGLYFSFRERATQQKLYPLFLRVLVPTLLLPYVANTAGWLLTELGRQPWTVFGLLRVEDSVSPDSVVSAGAVLASLVIFVLVYGVLMLADVYLLRKVAQTGPAEEVLTETLGAY